MIPFFDLKAQSRRIRPEVEAAIRRVLDSCEFALGSEVAAFEEAFARFCGGRHAVGVNSGTSALHVALLAAGVGPGDEVVAPAMTFAATVAAIEYVGARPVLVDVDPKSYTMSVEALERVIGERTRAVIPVHLYGQPADMDPILEIARRRGLVVIEDAAQAHGATYKGRPVGSLGDLGCFSFYPGKNLGAHGEAGLVVTHDEGRALRMRMLRDWGQAQKYHHVVKGFNYRMDGIQGAVLGVKLRHLPGWTERRQALAARYDELLSQISQAGDGLVPPARLDYAGHVYHLYAIRLRNRDAVRKALLDRGVQSGVHYPEPVHLVEAYREGLGYRPGDFPVAEKLAREELSLPLYPELEEGQVEAVCAALEAILTEAAR